jgi:hypothetical protein
MKEGWSLCKDGKNLAPLKFSNGKTQEDVVSEVLDAVNEGYKIIFIRGVCGTGKSAIALNLAKNFNKTSIVVPIKNLQRQYADDYMKSMHLLKDNGEKLKIQVMLGRNNFECPFLREGKNRLIGEENYQLADFSEKKDIISDNSCDNHYLPCTIELKEGNMRKIKEYLKKNPRIKSNDFKELKDVRRMSIAPICAYWGPIVPAEISLNLDSDVRNYKGLNNRTFSIHSRKPGCGYYNQFNSYLDADVLIFNSQKYSLETIMDRKPATDIEIVDECDEFLDNFANFEKINLTRLKSALIGLSAVNQKTEDIINRLSARTSMIINSQKTSQYLEKNEILPLKDTEISDIFDYFLDHDLMSSVECDDENYCYHCDEVARTFEDFVEDAYVCFGKEDRDITAKILTVSLEKKLSKLIEKNKVFVMMSGTVHDEKVLKELYGIRKFKIIEAETKMPGKITKSYTGKEMNCRYANFKSGQITRPRYLEALGKCIESAKKPVLVHVNSFSDLPSAEEADKYCLNIMTQEKLKALQKEKDLIKRFKRGEIEILYSTRCNRGVDFPGEMCNSIVLTKYPYPDVNSLFWRILKKDKPEHYNEFYIDKARREFMQRIYRGLRSEKDHIFLYSPDIRVFQGI